MACACVKVKSKEPKNMKGSANATQKKNTQKKNKNLEGSRTGTRTITK